MSTIKVDTVDTRTGSGNITFSRPTVLTAGDIVTADIAADAIDGTKIADNAVGSEHIADNAVDSEHYTDGSIDNVHTNFQPGTTFKGDGSSARGKITLNCEMNTHGVSIQSPAHSSAASYTLTLPPNDGAANEALTTDGSGVLSWAAAAAGGMQVQEDYFSMNMSRATGTTVVTLDTDFTATPQVMWMSYNNNYGAGGWVMAWMNVEGETAGTQNPGNDTYGQGNSYLQCNTGAGRQNIEFTASTSGASSAATYTITNTKVSSPAGTGYFSVLVFG